MNRTRHITKFVLCLMVAVLPLAATAGGDVAGQWDMLQLNTLTDTAEWHSMPQGAAMFTVRVRGSLPNDKRRNGHSPLSWRLMWGADSAAHTYHFAELRGHVADFGDLTEVYTVNVALGRHTSSGDSIISKTALTQGPTAPGRLTSLMCEFAADGTAKVFAGYREAEYIGTIEPTDGNSLRVWGIGAQGSWKPAWGETRIHKDMRAALATGLTEEVLDQRLEASTDKMEGIWQFLDRSNDEKLAVPGGLYTIATISSNDGGYDIIYLSGAEANADGWQAGMLKGHLSPTMFTGHYDLEWYDADFVHYTRDTHATLTDGPLLQLDFATLGAVMRFSKQPQHR